MLEINFVYDKDALSVKKFLKEVECHDIINYMDITNKLTKNDIYSVEPSDIIISSYITKYLEKTIIQKNNRIIFYVINSFLPEVIFNIKDYLYELIDEHELNEEIQYNIFLKPEFELDNKLETEFDNRYELVL
jgi:hypothetical protein